MISRVCVFLMVVSCSCALLAQNEPDAPLPPVEPATPVPPAPPVAPDMPLIQGVPPASHPEMRGILPIGSPFSFDGKADQEVVVYGRDVHIPAGTTKQNVVVAFGNLTLDGQVEGDVIVVGGTAVISGRIGGDFISVLGSSRLTSTANVEQSIYSVGGPTVQDSGATVAGDDFSFLADPRMAGAFHAFIAWVKGALLKGRLLIPEYGWWWWVFGVVAATHVLIVMLFPKAIIKCTAVIKERPLATYALGLLMFILVLPVFLLLVATAVGILIVPFLAAAVVVVLAFGRTAIFCYAGDCLSGRSKFTLERAPMLALVIGLLLFTLAYMVPILGLFTWAFTVPFGLGSVALALFQARPRSAPETVHTSMASNPAGPAAGTESPSLGASPSEIHPPEGLLLPLAGLGSRLAALCLDIILLIMLSLVVGGHIFWIGAFYFILLWAWRGTTVGGIIIGLKIVRTTGLPVNLGVAVVRALGTVFSASVFLLGFLWAAFDRQKQTWHDKIAGTLVVKTPKGVPLV